MRKILYGLAAFCLMSQAQAEDGTAAFTTLKGHGGPIMAITVGPDGAVSTASFDNAIGVWDDRVPTWLDGHDAAVTTLLDHPTGLISGGDDFRVLRWPDHAEPPEALGHHLGKVSALAGRGGRIASASWDGTIQVYSDGATQILKGHSSGVNAIAFDTPDLLYSAGTDGTVRLWTLSTGDNRIIVKHGFGINRMILDRQAGWLAYGAVDGVTRIIDLFTETEIKDLSLDRRPILALAYHAPTSQLAVGDGEGYIMMVDTKNWRITRDFRATRQGPIWALGFSPAGDVIYAGGLDDVAYGWPVHLLGELDPTMAEARSFLKDPETMSNGERQFMRKCSICHATDPGPSRKAGPTLAGVFGRAAGSVDGYPYSDTLKTTSVIWDDHSIDALFDQGPNHYIPGSKMPMQVIAAAQDRADLIAWLKTATTQNTRE